MGEVGAALKPPAVARGSAGARAAAAAADLAAELIYALKPPEARTVGWGRVCVWVCAVARIAVPQCRRTNAPPCLVYERAILPCLAPCSFRPIDDNPLPAPKPPLPPVPNVPRATTSLLLDQSRM